ncbi:hypothetical protein MMC07_005714 [Pseudocyphellaria aurata]|nr:hypothetical protein [Pseudocyphellaria aurata]
MEGNVSDQAEGPPSWSREHTMNKIITEMLIHTNPAEQEGLSIEQLEAVQAVMLAASSSIPETAPDDPMKPVHINSALLKQDVQTIRVLDDMCFQFVKDSITKSRIEKWKKSLALNEPGPASKKFTATGLQLQGLSSRSLRVSDTIKQLELKLQASNFLEQPPLARVASLVREKSLRNAPKDSPISASSPIQPRTFRSSAESEVPAKVPGTGLLASVINHTQPQAFGASPESAYPPLPDPDEEEEKELQEISPLSTPDMSEISDQDDANHFSPDWSKDEKALQELSPISTPDVPGTPNQVDSEQPLQVAEASTPVAQPKKSQLPIPVSMRDKSQTITPIFPSAGKSSGIPRRTFGSLKNLENM